MDNLKGLGPTTDVINPNATSGVAENQSKHLAGNLEKAQEVVDAVADAKEHAQNSLDKFRRVLWFCMTVCFRLGSGYRVGWLSGIEGRIIQIISCTFLK